MSSDGSLADSPGLLVGVRFMVATLRPTQATPKIRNSILNNFVGSSIVASLPTRTAAREDRDPPLEVARLPKIASDVLSTSNAALLRRREDFSVGARRRGDISDQLWFGIDS
mmetsp:Transcript_10545/g.20021  ORF Transcript_10545/g.20021 Transcript_10545/m.20021 type:complete len:112 (-) Transcript_10545:12-347(-)